MKDKLIEYKHCLLDDAQSNILIIVNNSKTLWKIKFKYLRLIYFSLENIDSNKQVNSYLSTKDFELFKKLLKSISDNTCYKCLLEKINKGEYRRGKINQINQKNIKPCINNIKKCFESKQSPMMSFRIITNDYTRENSSLRNILYIAKWYRDNTFFDYCYSGSSSTNEHTNDKSQVINNKKEFDHFYNFDIIAMINEDAGAIFELRIDEKRIWSFIDFNNNIIYPLIFDPNHVVNFDETMISEKNDSKEWIINESNFKKFINAKN